MFLFLFFCAVAAGWWLGRTHFHHKNISQSNRLSNRYFAGLNFLLNEQPDRAIKVFINMLEDDSEAVELHLTLGDLSRRQGEVQRAIRIHQHLLARPTLSSEQKAQILLELGRDFFHAGLLDRAENIFKEVLASGKFKAESLTGLQGIYQQEKDWEKAIQTGLQLRLYLEEDNSPIIAHYYCELAEESTQSGGLAYSKKLFKKALDINNRCVRANLSLGRFEEKLGNYKEAIKAFKKVKSQALEFLPEILPNLSVCYSKLGKKKDYYDYLEKCLNETLSTSVILEYAEYLHKTQHKQVAINFMAGHLKQRPTLRGINYLINIQQIESTTDAKESLEILSAMVTALVEHKPKYSCTSCGFSGKKHHWQCPSCKNWDIIVAVQGVEGE